MSRRPDRTSQPGTDGARQFNGSVAEILRDCGVLLQQQDANPFRVQAYLRAAKTLESLDTDVRDILTRQGVDGLVRLPSIGRGLAAAIEEIVRTGRLTRLDRLRGTSEPEALFQTIPGLGPALSHAVHERLHVDSLEALELAAHDGRLESVPGIGPRRAAAISASLNALLARGPRSRRERADGPPVGLLLKVDADYRNKSERDLLPKVAPRRFNPDNVAWLPILHAQLGDWHFTALFSNTARAHELGRTRDWVVVYFYDDDHEEGQHTIVTETHGTLRGRRVVRGREAECARFYGSGEDARSTGP
jgi:hypothetical protein